VQYKDSGRLVLIVTESLCIFLQLRFSGNDLE
jgi:hypothetical protein